MGTSLGSVELLPIELSGDWDLNPGDVALLAILTYVELLSGLAKPLYRLCVLWEMIRKKKRNKIKIKKEFYQPLKASRHT